jgi:signal transduction histidine kinase
VLALPLRSEERPIGALLIGFHEKHPFTPAEVAWAAQAAELIALAIDKAQAYAELKARNEELDAFSHTVAHDLKAPLAALSGYLELLTADLQDDLSADHRQMLERARISASRQNQIIESLLMLAQLRQTDLPLGPVYPRQIVAIAADRFRDQIEARGIDVKIAASMPPVVGYGPWLEEVFANLIANAVKYIGKKNASPTITVEARMLNDVVVRFEVIDNGLGITVEDQKNLFEMFSRHHTQEAGGLGLGLSIVNRVIARLDGQLGVESEEGQGSTFWFTLPLAESQPVPENPD